jgi:RNA polymerase sigma-70 factor (ECF subfamily)
MEQWSSEHMNTRLADSTISDTQRWIAHHGDYLYRFALARVRDRDAAEDLVQETFLAALQGSYSESGPSAERRWMIGIIKHKIVDYFRRVAREPLHDFDPSDSPSADEDFLPDGHWKPAMAAIGGWPERPDGLLERKQFWEVFATCLEKLPPRAAEIFTLREIDGVETDEICNLLNLTATNLGVILHRARKQLRNCLAGRYFGRRQGAETS